MNSEVQKHRDSWTIKVPLKESLKKGLIFGLQSRLPVGLILGFLDYTNHVVPLLQIISHGTRAYIWNENGLLGFVKRI